MDVFMRFQDGESVKELEIKNVSDRGEFNIIFGFFETVGVPAPIRARTIGRFSEPETRAPESERVTSAKSPTSQPAREFPGATVNFNPNPPATSPPGAPVSDSNKNFIPVPKSPAPAAPKLKDDRLDDMIQKALHPGKPKPRVLPKVGEENRTSFPVKDIVRKVNPAGRPGDPEHWRTGVKTDEKGVKCYKCRYWCKCSHQSNIYIPLGEDRVNCYECGNEIHVKPATGRVDVKGVPERDEFGNFFVAR